MFTSVDHIFLKVNPSHLKEVAINQSMTYPFSYLWTIVIFPYHPFKDVIFVKPVLSIRNLLGGKHLCFYVWNEEINNIKKRAKRHKKQNKGGSVHDLLLACMWVWIHDLSLDSLDMIFCGVSITKKCKTNYLALFRRMIHVIEEGETPSLFFGR